MYATQPPQQIPYLVPVPQATYPQQTQGDGLNNLDKLIDIADKLADRRSGGNLQPGTSQYSPMNAAMFQNANPQQLAIQEYLLRNPHLISQYQQQTAQQQQSFPNSQQQQERTYSYQQVSELKNQFDVAVNCANQHYKQLQQLWEMSQQIMNCYNAICNYAKELENYVRLGQASNIHANAFLQELNAAYDVVNIQHQMLTTPLYLLSHSFSTFEREIQPGDDKAANTISTFYLDFIKSFEEKKRSMLGSYSPQYQEYLQASVNNNYPQTPQPQQQEIDSVLAWAQGLKSEGFGKQIKRTHTQQLLRR